MKKQFIIATFAALAFFATACGKQDGAATGTTENAATNLQSTQWASEEVGTLINYSDIEPAIMQFVETHFPQTGIYNCHQTQHYYKVRLNDQTKLTFTHSFDWIEVDCEHSTIYGSVPASIVPEQITAYVGANFPNNHIDQIEKENYGWDVELNNDREIKFDHDFNVIGGGNNGGGNGGGNTTTDYPEINTFVSTYFPQTTIQHARPDGNEIDVKLADGTDIDFYLNFDWQSIDCDEATIYGSVPAELVPSQIADYVAANFPNNHIDQIEKMHNGNWEIELNNDREIKFDANFNVISGGNNGGGNGGGNTTTDYPEINTFVSTYFPQTTIQHARPDGNEIDVKLADGTDIDFYLNFDWQSIDCDEATIYGSVPAELVPSQIADYVAANFPNNHIDQIEKMHNGNWEIELNNDREIKFDANFNVISGGNNGGGNGGGNNGGNTSNYPEINTFVSTYFPQTSIQYARQDGNEIEVKLADKTEIDFYLNFDWKQIDCEKSLVYSSVPTELVPAQITAYVSANFPGKVIETIEKKHNGGWEIELSNGLEITFDANFNVTEIDDKK